LKPFTSTFTNSMQPAYFLSAKATTDSSSTGFKEQVEYEIFPPTLSTYKPLKRILAYKTCNEAPSFVFHLSHF